MKRFLICLLVLCLGITTYVSAKEEPTQLYAQSAVLMDAKSGRVLFEKNGYDARPMASTTKIMTCILALENGDLEDIVDVGDEAVSQPKVHLGMQKGEQFYLKDLLHSLMLESHNDSAVAIAEHIGGSVEGFARMMNKKARKIGCYDTHFVSPNGLDSFDDEGKHATTAADLAKIMSYCITESPKKAEFLEITRTQSYGFQDVKGKRSFSCNNHNAFLKMMDGALSGKTGFTGDAGYCYVGALKRDGRTFVVALLACGWPNNRSYKWSDTKALMEYALDTYHYEEVYEKEDFKPIPVADGIPAGNMLFEDASVSVGYKDRKDARELEVLMSDDEEVKAEYDLPEQLEAPIKAGETIGAVRFYLGNQMLKEYAVVAKEDTQKISFKWLFSKIMEKYLIHT